MNSEAVERVMRRVCMRVARGGGVEVGNGCEGEQRIRDDKERVDVDEERDRMDCCPSKMRSRYGCQFSNRR